MPIPALAALHLYPEVFQKHRDDYMYYQLTDMLSGIEEELEGERHSTKMSSEDYPETEAQKEGNQKEKDIFVFVGNIHTEPIEAIWKRNDSKDEDAGEKQGRRTLKLKSRKEREVEKAKLKLEDIRLGLGELIYIYRDMNKESADHYIKKQALLEALFSTQVWGESYVRDNQFFYITPNKKDLDPDGEKYLLNQFKKIFLKSYRMYSSILNKVVPSEIAD